jgi:hypothetical protein
MDWMLFKSCPGLMRFISTSVYHPIVLYSTRWYSYSHYIPIQLDEVIAMHLYSIIGTTRIAVCIRTDPCYPCRSCRFVPFRTVRSVHIRAVRAVSSHPCRFVPFRTVRSVHIRVIRAVSCRFVPFRAVSYLISM